MSKIHNTSRVLAGLMVCAAAAPLAFAGGGYYNSGPSYTPDLLPPSSNPGECYARVKIPAEYSHTTETVMVKEGYTKSKVTQPRLQSRQEKVLSKEASVRYEVRQPTFKTVSEQMMVRPAYDKLSVTSPQFKTVTEKMQVSNPRLVWKRGNPGKLRSQGYTIHSTADAGYKGQGYSSSSLYGGSCGTECEIWCLVEEPGEAVSYQRKVMSSPGEVRRHTVPAKYRTVTTQVVADPGGVREIPVPAQYQSITVEDIVDPGGEHAYHVPPKYGNVNKKVLVSPERYEWRRVLCKPGTVGYSSGSSYSSGGSSYSSGSSNGSGSSYSSGSSYGSGSTYSGGTTAYSAPTYSSDSYSSGTYGTSHQSRTYGNTGSGYVTSGSSHHLPPPTYTKKSHSHSSGHYGHHKKRQKLRHRNY